MITVILHSTVILDIYLNDTKIKLLFFHFCKVACFVIFFVKHAKTNVPVQY